MKKYLAVLGLSGMLGACAISPAGQPTIGGIDIATVQADAVLVCSYLPAAGTIASIIAANNPITLTAEAVAAAICAAVAPNSVAARRALASGVYIPPSVVIQGHFVKKR
jgi:hypothetical protein